MSQYHDLVGALTWLVIERLQSKGQYTRGVLGDGQGHVQVPGRTDFSYVRPDRYTTRRFEVFNKRVDAPEGTPVIVGELPWQPGLTQVLSADYDVYLGVGWGDGIGVTKHGATHMHRDAAPAPDTFPVYRRQMGELRAYPLGSGSMGVNVSSYSFTHFDTVKSWPGLPAVDLSAAVPSTTGSACFALVYWDPCSGTSGHLGVATGTLGADADPAVLNRPAAPAGTIPSAWVRLRGGAGYLTEFDFWDAREPWRPSILFSTGSCGVHAGRIPIADDGGYYTGTTVEAALQEQGGVDPRAHEHSKLVNPAGTIDPAFSINATGTALGEYDLVVGHTAQGVVEAVWFDHPLMDSANESGIADQFRQNAASYPTDWTEVDAAATSRTDSIYSFWRLHGTSAETSYKYRVRNQINLETGGKTYMSFILGPLVLRDAAYTADVDYYYGIYRDNAGAIDENTYGRVHVQWDSASSLWRIRGEERDGSTGHTGTWVSLDQDPLRPLYVRSVVYSGASKQVRTYFGGFPYAGFDTLLLQQNPTSAPTWGQLWYQFHQSRGAGLADWTLIGGLDFEDTS